MIYNSLYTSQFCIWGPSDRTGPQSAAPELLIAGATCLRNFRHALFGGRAATSPARSRGQPGSGSSRQRSCRKPCSVPTSETGQEPSRSPASNRPRVTPDGDARHAVIEEKLTEVLRRSNDNPGARQS
jgi:hypothetical protein